jgi:DNA-directed RNA polymerase specialized sigma24 family protein
MAHPVDGHVYQELLTAARRWVRSEADARDLTQDALEAALVRGVSDWATPERRAWLRGLVRKRAAFLARGEARRQRREREAEAPTGETRRGWAWEPAFLASLPRSLGAVARLMTAELAANEIRWLLDLSDTALRQRLTALRRVLREHEVPPTVATPPPAASFGPQRQRVLELLRRPGGRVIATHDPDGHVLFLRTGAHKPEPSGNR